MASSSSSRERHDLIRWSLVFTDDTFGLGFAIKNHSDGQLGLRGAQILIYRIYHGTMKSDWRFGGGFGHDEGDGILAYGFGALRRGGG